MAAGDLVNHGFMSRPGAEPTDNATGRTFIISGVARSGTTLVAAVLQEAGLFLGNVLADVVHEDRELLAILQSGQRPLLADAIRRRNAEHRDWGFKIPNIHAYLRGTDLIRFRAPHLILIYRDPVAVSVRNAISEMFDQFATLAETAAAQLSVVEFVRSTDCACLLISYEKALIFADHFVDTLTGFCGLSPDAETRERLIRLVEPNPDTYLQRARRQFAGSIDTLQDGVLQGWCCQVDELEAVTVDLSLDGEKLQTVRADRFRPDLLAAGYGNGNHGFCIDMTRFAAGEDAAVRVVVSGRTFVLPNSGKRLRDYAPAEAVSPPLPTTASTEAPLPAA